MPRFGYREIRIYPDGKVTERPHPEYPGYEECLGKAVPVPKHGRLIDADALMLIIQEYIEEYSDTDENGCRNLKWCAMKEAEMAINAAPTIIPAEEGE